MCKPYFKKGMTKAQEDAYVKWLNDRNEVLQDTDRIGFLCEFLFKVVMTIGLGWYFLNKIKGCDDKTTR